MMVASKRERFPLPRVSGCCRFGQRTFAGASGNDEDAPKAAVRRTAIEPPESTPFETFMPAPVAGRVTQEAVIRLRLLVMLADRLMLVRRAALLPLSD